MDYFVGLSLSSGSSLDSGIAIMDENNKLILVDKYYKMNDIIFFFENYSSLNNSHICISLPWDRTMLDGKWRILSKPYQLVSSNSNILNRDNWTQRYASRGSEFFKELSDKGVDIHRFELYLTRQSLRLNSCYKERSPADCKFLQQALKFEWGFDELPANMMPMSQLEAIVGAILAKEAVNNNFKQISEFRGLDVIDIYKTSSANLVTTR